MENSKDWKARAVEGVGLLTEALSGFGCLTDCVSGESGRRSRRLDFDTFALTVRRFTSEADETFRALAESGTVLPDAFSGELGELLEAVDVFAGECNLCVFSLIERGQWINGRCEICKSIYEEMMAASGRCYSALSACFPGCEPCIPRTRNVKGELLFAEAEKTSRTEDGSREWLTPEQWDRSVSPEELSWKDGKGETFDENEIPFPRTEKWDAFGQGVFHMLEGLDEISRAERSMNCSLDAPSCLEPLYAAKKHLDDANMMFDETFRLCSVDPEPKTGMFVRELHGDCLETDVMLKCGLDRLLETMRSSEWLGNLDCRWKKRYGELQDETTMTAKKFCSAIPLLTENWKDYVRGTRDRFGRMLFPEAELESSFDSSSQRYITEEEWEAWLSVEGDRSRSESGKGE